MKEKFQNGLYALIFMGFLSCGSGKKTTADYEVIPIPQKIDLKEDNPFTLKNSTSIVYTKGNAELERIANFLADYIKFSTGKVLKVTDEPATKNAIILASQLDNKNTEAYNMKVSPESIIINGASEAGTFYGIQTLRKSIDASSDDKDVEFPSVDIQDYPRFAYRGMHLDVGRHMFSVEFIKEYIDLLALHNMNKFHWHLTDDQGWRIEIKKYPELTENGSIRKQTVIGRNSGKFDGKPYGGYYTQEEAREIVKYAQDRFITVIPEVDLPGHMLAALTAFPNLGCTGGPYDVEQTWGVFEDVLCAGNDDTYTFLENVFSEIIDIFPSEYIHIGGDECPKSQWKKCPKCQAKIKQLGLKADDKHSAEEKLQSYVISTIEKFLNGKGRKIIGWDEILEGGLAPNATVMSWRGMDGAAFAAQHGNDAIMTPTSYLYFDYYQTTDVDNVPLAIGGYIPLEKVYSFNPIPEGLTPEQEKHIIGVQANLWTEYIPNSKQVEYMVLPRMDALSEIQWTMPDKRNYEEFVNRLSRMMKLYDKEGYNYSKSVLDINAKSTVIGGKTIELTLSTVDGAPIHYTLDGSEPTVDSPIYQEPISITKTTDVKAIAVRDGKPATAKFSQAYNINKATMKPITLNQEPHGSYIFGGAPALVDGIWGNAKSYKDGSWIGFTKDDLEIIVDLEEEQEVSEVELGTYVYTADWIFGATGLTVSVSNDGKKYTKVASKKIPMPTEHIQEAKIDEVSFKPVKARYIKILVNKVNKMPKWHSGAGSSAFIFVDEVRIN